MITMFSHIPAARGSGIHIKEIPSGIEYLVEEAVDVRISVTISNDYAHLCWPYRTVKLVE
jgi:hypothetical protein